MSSQKSSSERSMLAAEIERFRATQFEVYRVQPGRMARDANSAREMARDHLGRWVLELLQNADDAGATSVRFLVTDIAVYVADDGSGLTTDAIESLSGTFLSRKVAGIGRKGVGFKSVYNATSSPHVFVGDDDGVCFDPELARHAIAEAGLPPPQRVPHEWLPFWTSRRAKESEDQHLLDFRAFSTVVKLPLRDINVVTHAEMALESLSASILITFNSLRQISVQTPNGGFELRAEGETDEVHCIRDSREDSFQRWHVRSAVLPVPEPLLTTFDEDERERQKTAKVLSAALLADDGFVIDEAAPPLHVYYPTEHAAPCSMLLHADFVVSSDRRNVISPLENPYNGWLTQELAEHVVSHIAACYNPDAPSRYLRLLGSTAELKDGSVEALLSEHFNAIALERLRLPDVEARLLLRTDYAVAVDPNAFPSEARQLIATTAERDRLIHQAFDTDIKAVHVLRSLRVDLRSTSDILHVLALPQQEPPRRKFIVSAWQWLACWFSAATHSFERGQRSEKVATLPLLPLDTRVIASDSEEGNRAAWGNPTVVSEVPEWLPLLPVAPWFVRWIEQQEDERLRSLVKALEIKPPDARLVLTALRTAAEQYWREPAGDPSRFMRFLAENRSLVEAAVRIDLGEVAVPVLEEDPKPAWYPASTVYFGEAWGNHELALLYRGVGGIRWLAPPTDTPGDVGLLVRVGVASSPRLENNKDVLDYATSREWLSPLNRGSDRARRDPSAMRLFGVQVDRLDESQAIALCSLLAKHWQDYEPYLQCSVPMVGPRGGDRVDERIDHFWLWELKTRLRMPVVAPTRRAPAPCNCWLSGDAARRLEGLVPVVASSRLGNNASSVIRLLLKHLGVRQTLRELQETEMKSWLREEVSELTAENLSVLTARRFARWYEAALEASSEQYGGWGPLGVPLVCRRGDTAEVAETNGGEEIYIDDSPEAASVFGESIRVVSLNPRHFEAGRRILGVKSLTAAVSEELLVDPQNVPFQPDAGRALNALKPFIFAVATVERKLNEEEFGASLTQLEVRGGAELIVRWQLTNPAATVEVNRPFIVTPHALLIQAQGARPLLLARAVALWLRDQWMVRRDSTIWEVLLGKANDAERHERLREEGLAEDLLKRATERYRAMFIGGSSPSPESSASTFDTDPLATSSETDEGTTSQPGGNVLPRPQPGRQEGKNDVSLPDQTNGKLAEDGNWNNSEGAEESGDDDGPTWKASVAPDVAATTEGQEYVPNPVRDVVNAHQNGTTGATAPEPKNKKPPLSPAFLKAIGRWGEEWLARRQLPEELLKRHPGARLSFDAGTVRCLLKGSVVETVEWLNEESEQKLPYDLIIRRGSDVEWVEVKASTTQDLASFDVTGEEWDHATRKRQQYVIYRIWGAGSKQPSYTRIPDPVGLWREGQLRARPVRVWI